MEIEDCVERRYWCGIRSSSDSSECKDPDFFPVENGGITYNYRKNYRTQDLFRFSKHVIVENCSQFLNLEKTL